MTKTQIKFYFTSVALTSLIVLVFFALVYLISLVLLPIIYLLIIWIFLALALSSIITYAYMLTSSTIADAMVTLRRISHADNLSHPLMLRLSNQAPGTYHHSLNVSNLAHKTAKVIGADSALVRTASYYHDLGKLIDPKVFIENQSGHEVPNEENSLWIRNNAKKIISHVSQGVKIAQEAKLPDDIIQIIAEHHGTTKAIYFYEKALEHKLKIKKIDFSYSGPIPQSRESAIVMLCDCLEAASRTLQPINREAIERLVIDTIEEKNREKQLNHALFSANDMKLIKSTLCDSLESIYHQRVSYKK